MPVARADEVCRARLAEAEADRPIDPPQSPLRHEPSPSQPQEAARDDHRHHRRPPGDRLARQPPPSIASKASSTSSRRPRTASKCSASHYAKAVDVYYNLKEYFEDELKGEHEQMLDWWGNVQDTGPKDKGMQLSKRRTLRIIWDPPSNSILVANASPSQLYEIEQLIKEYDQPASADSTKTRSTGVIKFNYSRASKIAAAIKDVYRDLLSSKDKEFDANEKKEQGSSRESVTVIRYNNGGGEGDGAGQKTAPLKVGFEGALSIGADDISNVLFVSAQEEIFEGVVQMIHRLDEEARPHTTVQVHRVSGNIDAKKLQRALSGALGTPWLGNRPEKPEAETPAAEKPKPEQNDRGSKSRRQSQLTLRQPTGGK